MANKENLSVLLRNEVKGMTSQEVKVFRHELSENLPGHTRSFIRKCSRKAKKTRSDAGK